MLLWLTEAQVSDSFPFFPCWFLLGINLWNLASHCSLFPCQSARSCFELFSSWLWVPLCRPWKEKRELFCLPNAHVLWVKAKFNGHIWHVKCVCVVCFHKHSPEWKQGARAMMWLRLPRWPQNWGWSPEWLSSVLLTSKTGEGTTVQDLQLLVSLGPKLKHNDSSAFPPKLLPTVISFLLGA